MPFPPARRIAALLLPLLGSLPAATHAAPVHRVTKDAAGVTLHLGPGMLRLQVWGPSIVRVTYAPGDAPPPDHSFSVIGKPADVKWDVSETADAVSVTTADVRARVDRQTGAVAFADAAGKPFLSELPGGRSMGTHPLSGHDVTAAAQAFALADGEALYGLGQHQDGAMNRVGQAVQLLQQNMQVAVPVLVSSNGYGVLWDNPAVTQVDVAKADPHVVRWSSEAADAVDYYVFRGPSLDRVVAGYRTLTGGAPMFAKWAWGYWQSRERYKTQDELLAVAREYRRRQIPIDGMVQDWQYWIPTPWGSHAFGVNFPDPKAMSRELHDRNLHWIISVWAKFDKGTRNYDELKAGGFLYPPLYQNVYPKGQAQWYDAFNPAARQVYWRQLSEDLFVDGVDGWWLDATEPELGGKWGEFRDLKTAAGPGYAVFNAYPLQTTTGVHDGQRAQTSDKRVFILTRSAYAGQQRNGAVTWSGDIKGDWATFAKQVPAGLNFSLSGIPYWNTDIGGFFCPKPTDPKYRELFTRWFQFGAFCPMFRVHGSGVKKEMWEFGPDVEPILVKYDRLRYRLLPYTYSVAWSVTHDSGTMMRPLVMDFPDDAKARDLTDQYLFGPALMVNPVTHARATTRPVYLPGQAAWTDFDTGKRYDAARSVDMPAPLTTIPLLVRAGSIVPLGPVVQYASEPSDPTELRVYRGADGTFTLYDDEGDNYDYEKGVHATIPLTWDDAKRTLTIGPRDGTYPGMVPARTFRITWVRDGVGVGPDPTVKADVEVKYTGAAVAVPEPSAIP